MQPGLYHQIVLTGMQNQKNVGPDSLPCTENACIHHMEVGIEEQLHDTAAPWELVKVQRLAHSYFSEVNACHHWGQNVEFAG